MKKYIRPLVALVMAVTFMVMYLTTFTHIITFHEQHHLFVFSTDYLSHMSHQEGWLSVITDFIVQFGYWPWLGALVWTAILVATYLMTSSIIRRLTGFRDLLQLSAILPCWMFFRTVDIDSSPSGAVAAFLIVLGLWVVALVAGIFLHPRKRGEEGEKGKWWWLLSGPVIFAVIFSIFNYRFYAPRTITLPSGTVRDFTREEIKAQRRAEGLMIKADQAVRRADWPEVQRLADEALGTGGKNHLMAYFRAMALYHQGKLVNHIFDLPQRFGSRSLFFPWKADKNQAEYGGYVYEQLGALNTAIHWEFEALVGWGETASHLINLAKYYIETGKPAQARKFIYPLKRTLFYRSTARQLEQWMAAGDVPGLEDAYASEGANDRHWDAVDNLTTDLAFMLEEGKANDMARQYILMSLLLKNDVGRFYEVLKIICPRPQRANLPAVYQQALCLARLGLGEAKVAADGFVISPEIDAAMRAYLAEHGKGNMARFTPEQKRTYWYYIHFISPEGQSVSI